MRPYAFGGNFKSRDDFSFCFSIALSRVRNLVVLIIYGLKVLLFIIIVYNKPLVYCLAATFYTIPDRTKCAGK